MHSIPENIIGKILKQIQQKYFNISCGRIGADDYCRYILEK